MSSDYLLTCGESVIECHASGESQLGITFGRGVGMIFKDGVPMRKVAGENIVDAFVMETEKLLEDIRRGSTQMNTDQEEELVQIVR